MAIAEDILEKEWLANKMKQKSLNRIFMYENCYFLMPQENICFGGLPVLSEELFVEVDAVRITHLSQVNEINAKAKKLPPPEKILNNGISQMLQKEPKLEFFNSYLLLSSKRFQKTEEARPSTREEHETHKIMFCYYEDNGRMLVPIGYLEKLSSTREKSRDVPAFL